MTVKDQQGGWDAFVVDGHGAYSVCGSDVNISGIEIETPSKSVSMKRSRSGCVGRRGRGSGGPHAHHDGLPWRPSKATGSGETRWVRTIIDKVCLRTIEIPDQFPVVLPGSAAPPSPGNAVRSPEFVHSREEAAALA